MRGAACLQRTSKDGSEWQPRRVFLMDLTLSGRKPTQFGEECKNQVQKIVRKNEWKL